MENKKEKKTHPLQRWKQKKELETKKIKFDGAGIEIRELSGKEKDTFVKFENNAKAAFYIWDKCVNNLNPEWVMFEDEFLELYDMNSSEISAIINEILYFSGMDEEAKALLEKE